MNHYDIAILGAGAAGLSLALALIDSPLKEKKILLVDKDLKNSNDRTWCYWTDRPDEYDRIRRKFWGGMKFSSQGEELEFNLTPYRYQMVRGLDFYCYARDEFARFTNIHWITGNVEEVQDRSESALFSIDGKELSASWVFDSRIRFSEIQIRPEKYSYLKQHFLGWEIETSRNAFDSDMFTMFDLCASGEDGFCFYYILPFTNNSALVEFTVFSETLWEDSRYKEALESYLAESLNNNSYRILEEERGVIPMTDHPFPRKLGDRIMSIGTHGGRVKPSTGYAFSRIQRDSKAITRSLEKYGHPFHVPRDSARRRFYDSLLLEVLKGQSTMAPEIFTKLYKRNDIRRVLRFLDEKTTLMEEVMIIASLPPVPFLKALGIYLRKKILSAST
jgi:lycopene beta-cyclase